MINTLISIISGTYGLIKLNKRITNDNIEIFYDPNKNSCFIAKSMKNFNKDIIIVDDIFINTTNDIQEAIVYHELGHIKSKNIYCDITDEILADIYTLDNIGKKRTLKMLNEVKNILIHNNKGTKEISIRIDFIKKYRGV